LLAGDEEKALAIYRAVTSGHSLETDLHPSLPYPLVGCGEQTPMHMAAIKAMGELLKLFLEHGGNPNVCNTNNETCLHSICKEPERDVHKRQLIELLVSWRGIEKGSEKGSEDAEYVSVNHVDNDGNTATHYAASSGLTDCVIYLAALGAIISIVNLDQMTPCEMSESKGHSILADMLEVALVFPSPEQDLCFLDIDRDAFNYENRSPIFLLDAKNYSSDDILLWRDDLIESAVCALGLPPSRAEKILAHYNWEIERMVMDFFTIADEILKSAALESVYIDPEVRYADKIGKTRCWRAIEQGSEKPSVKRSEDRSEVEVGAVSLQDQDRITSGEVVSPLFTSQSSGSISPVVKGESSGVDISQPIDTSSTKTEMTTPEKTSEAPEQIIATMIATEVSTEEIEEEVEYCSICSEPFTSYFSSKHINSHTTTTTTAAASNSIDEGSSSCVGGVGIDGSVVDDHCAVACGSGHVFCLECWRTHSTMQVPGKQTTPYILLPPLTISSYYHPLLSHLTIMSHYHLTSSLNITSSFHILLSSFTFISY
jgi:hypothetical protein